MKVTRLRDNDPGFLYRGQTVETDTAQSVLERWLNRDMWDRDDVMPIWKRLLDRNEVYEERMECAEIVSRITHDELEIFVAEPV